MSGKEIIKRIENWSSGDEEDFTNNWLWNAAIDQVIKEIKNDPR